MITFYEGLPRSGKSYSAMKDEIIPALAKGRTVCAYIEGLDHDKIAPLAGLSPDRCRELLKVLSRDDVKTVWDHVDNDALVILDESQNFWPSGRSKMGEEMTQFITEHGHRGLDIVLMGQAIKDVHNLWRRRVERKIYFNKQTAIGKPNSYSATFYTSVPRGDDVAFEQVQSLTYQYDEKFFGTYKSHTDGTSNKETLVDGRAVIWNRPLFRYILPAFGALFLAALIYVVWFFKSGAAVPSKSSEPIDGARQFSGGQVVSAPAPLPAPASAPVSASAPGGANGAPLPLPQSLSLSEPKDVVESLNERGRIRLLGFVRVGDSLRGLVEWRDSALNLVHAMTFLELSGLGYMVMTNQTGTIATLRKGDTEIVALAWPLDQASARPSRNSEAAISGNPQGSR